MSGKTRLIWRLGVVVLSLVAAVAVYCFARLNPPEMFVLLGMKNSLPASQVVLPGSAPSFLHTLSTDFLTDYLAELILTIIGPYWSRGVLDPLDLIAAAMGGGTALFVFTRFPEESNDEVAQL